MSNAKQTTASISTRKSPHGISENGWYGFIMLYLNPISLVAKDEYPLTRRVLFFGKNMNLTSEQIVRFWAKVDRSGNCWLWNGGKFQQGYGKWRVKSHGKQWYAHRLSFLLEKGYLPKKGLVLDHLCENRACVNPYHLNVTTIYLNAMRGRKYKYGIGYCVRGHLLEATRVTFRNGKSTCRICKRLHQVAYKRRRKARLLLVNGLK